MKISKSKDELKAISDLRFYGKYIDKNLAGDFSVDLANHVRGINNENQALRKELEAVKAASLTGYIENMEQLDYQANIRGEAGMRMMTSFALKTAKEYAKKLVG